MQVLTAGFTRNTYLDKMFTVGAPLTHVHRVYRHVPQQLWHCGCIVAQPSTGRAEREENYGQLKVLNDLEGLGKPEGALFVLIALRGLSQLIYSPTQRSRQPAATKVGDARLSTLHWRESRTLYTLPGATPRSFGAFAFAQFMEASENLNRGAIKALEHLNHGAQNSH